MAEIALNQIIQEEYEAAHRNTYRVPITSNTVAYSGYPMNAIVTVPAINAIPAIEHVEEEEADESEPSD